MRFVWASFVFILALALNIKSVANEAEVCTAENKDHCADKKNSVHATTEEHEKLGERMNSLFPEKQKNPDLSERPTTVKLTSPKFLSKISGNSVKLEWTLVSGATDYHLQVATDPNFKWLVANEFWVKTNSFDVTQLEGAKKYYWRVASIKNTNDAMFTKSLFVSSVFETTAK